jgi:hypothetical protein
MTCTTARCAQCRDTSGPERGRVRPIAAPSCNTTTMRPSLPAPAATDHATIAASPRPCTMRPVTMRSATITAGHSLAGEPTPMAPTSPGPVQRTPGGSVSRAERTYRRRLAGAGAGGC